MKKQLSSPFYLFLYPVFFVFHGFVQNFYFIPVVDSLLLTGIYCVSLFLLTLLFYIFYRKFQPSILLACFIISFNFFFGHLHDLLLEYFENTFLTKYVFILLIFLLLVILLAFLLKKSRDLSKINIYLNTLFILLIVIDIVSLSGKIFFSHKKEVVENFTTCDSCPKPDVYLILLDGYAGEEQLQYELNHNNTSFYDSLAARRFKTVNKSHSNYNYTPYSTASTLNMEYLDSSKATTNAGRKENKYVLEKIDKNQLISFFQQTGYDFFNYSVFKVNGQPPPVSNSFISSNSSLITANTFVGRFKKNVLPNIAGKLGLKQYAINLLYATNKDNKNNYNLTQKIANLTSSKPKIVYTHLMMPHHPYYYNEDGVLRKFESAGEIAMNDTAAYLSYLKYTNKEIIRLVDNILSKSASPPIIVLFSDHGFRYTLTDERKYVLSNLISIHLPSENYAPYNDSLSNVNLFRTILNNEFKQQLPLLENKIFRISF